MIEQELLQGTTKFYPQEDGTERVEHRAPNSKELRAARKISELMNALGGLSRAYATLESQYRENLQAFDKLSAAFELVQAEFSKLQANSDEKTTD